MENQSQKVKAISGGQSVNEDGYCMRMEGVCVFCMFQKKTTKQKKNRKKERNICQDSRVSLYSVCLDCYCIEADRVSASGLRWK